MRFEVILGDCVEEMARMEANSVDSIVCDPPYGLGFMGKEFDKLGSGVQQQEWHRRWVVEALRVLKPGGHLLAFGGTRTFHRLACAVEDAGFEIRDCIGLAQPMAWVFGSGFPKGRDISKAIDNAVGAEREVVGRYTQPDGTRRRTKRTPSVAMGMPNDHEGDMTITVPATPDAEKWDGWNTTLKPAWEPIVMARKPLSKKTVAANVLEHGTGAINIDGCRIESEESTVRENHGGGNPKNWRTGDQGDFSSGLTRGRWPANVILIHHPECECVGTKKVKACGVGSRKKTSSKDHRGNIGAAYGAESRPEGTPMVCHGDGDGKETVEDWDCHPDCPVGILNKQSGELKSGDPDTSKSKAANKIYGAIKDRGSAFYKADKGGASRFFYCAKASKAERNAGGRNNHPTVKPVKLMRYLLRLVTPPGGVVIDPFAGSGTTLVAAMQEGFSAIGIDKEPEYVKSAKGRMSRVGRVQGELF